MVAKRRTEAESAAKIAQLSGVGGGRGGKEPTGESDVEGSVGSLHKCTGDQEHLD